MCWFYFLFVEIICKLLLFQHGFSKGRSFKNTPSIFSSENPWVKFRAHSHSGDICNTFRWHSWYFHVTFRSYRKDIEGKLIIQSEGLHDTFFNLHEVFRGRSWDSNLQIQCAKYNMTSAMWQMQGDQMQRNKCNVAKCNGTNVWYIQVT